MADAFDQRIAEVKRQLDTRVQELTFEQLTELVAGATWEDFVAFILEKCPDLCGLPDADLRDLYQAFSGMLRHRLMFIAVPDWRVGTA
jgi:hypothetical protein